MPSKITTPEDMSKAVTTLIEYVANEMGIDEDTDILMLLAASIAGCVVVLAGVVSDGENVEQATSELLEIAIEDIRTNAKNLKVMKLDGGEADFSAMCKEIDAKDNTKKDEKPLLLN